MGLLSLSDMSHFPCKKPSFIFTGVVLNCGCLNCHSMLGSPKNSEVMTRNISVAIYCDICKQPNKKLVSVITSTDQQRSFKHSVSRNDITPI